MAPKTRVKESVRREEVEAKQTAADGEGDDAFAQLARKLWLKPAGKAAKAIKVKPDVLKKEIWDVLEKEDFPYSSLLTLEKLQLLDRYDYHLFNASLTGATIWLTAKTATFGQDIPRILRISTCC